MSNGLLFSNHEKAIGPLPAIWYHFFYDAQPKIIMKEPK